MTINENSEMRLPESDADDGYGFPRKLRFLEPQQDKFTAVAAATEQKKKAHNFACRVTKSSITSSEPPAIAFTRTSLYNLST
jgi:hypothetical protein